jgi:hypothetical protein
MAMVYSVSAQTVTWVGGTSNDWHTAANWSTNNVPGSSATVNIPSVSTYPVITQNVTVDRINLSQNFNGGELTILSGATLTVSDQFDVNDQARLYITNGTVQFNGAGNGQRFINMGYNDIIISFGADGVLNSPNARLQINGTVHLDAGTMTLGNGLQLSENKLLRITTGTLNVFAAADIFGNFDGGEGTITFDGNINNNQHVVVIRNGGRFYMAPYAPSVAPNPVCPANTTKPPPLSDGSISFLIPSEVQNNGRLFGGDALITYHQSANSQGDAITSVRNGTIVYKSDVTMSNTATLEVTCKGTIIIEGNGTFQQNGNMNLGDGSLQVDGDATFQNSGTLNAGEADITFSGNVTLANSGGTINAGESTITFEGDTFDNSGTFNAEESTFIFAGDGNQEITGSNTDIEFFNLVVDDGAQVTANQNVTVLNNMEVEDGAEYNHDNETTLNVVGDVIGDPQIDSDKPYVVSIQIIADDRIRLFFNIPVLSGTTGNGASNDANYALENPPSGYSLSAVQISDTVVEITFTNFQIVLPNEYFIIVNNLRSADNNTISGQISTDHRKRFGGSSASIPQPLQLRYYPGGLASTDLSLWFDADDVQYLFSDTQFTTAISNLSTVAHWTDKSPAGNDAIQSVSSLRPLFESGSAFGGRPAVRFNDSEFMPFNGGFVAGSDFTITAVVQRTAGTNFNVYLGGVDTGQNRNLHLFWNTSTTLNFHKYSNDLSATVPAFSASDTGELHLFRFESALANNNRVMRRNGEQLNSGGNNATMTSWNGAALGRYIDTGSATINERFTGYIGEIIAYSKAMNTAERIILENYAATKWDRPLDAAERRFSTTPGAHRRQLAGIGRHATTLRVDETVYTSGGMGMRSTTSGFLGSDGNYLLIAHDGQTGVSAASTFTDDEILERWNRVWYLHKTLPGNDGSVQVYFDYADFDLAAPDPAATYRLLFNPTEANFFTQSTNIAVPASVTVTGNEVRFDVNSSDLSNGYYTIARYLADAVADPDETLISASPLLIEADGASVSIITVQARYANGENLPSGGDTVTLSTTSGSLGSVNDNGDGTYTASLTSANIPGTATISGTINGDPIASTVQVSFEIGVADAGETLISANPVSILANGTATSTITVEARDVFGVALTSGGDAVTLSTTAGTLGGVTDNGDGTYTATLTSSTSFETATITGTINSASISSTAQVTFVAGAADAGNSTIFASPLIITADGVSASTIIVQLRDAFGNPLQSGGDTVTLSTTAGSLGSVTDNGDGTYSAALTSGVTVASALVTGTLNSTAIDDDVTVQFVDFVVRTYYPGGLDNTDLHAWYDAADTTTLFTDVSGTTPAGFGDPVARWDDKSTFSRHATQPTAGSRPVLSNTGAFGGRNSLVFTDTNQNHLIFDASFVEQSNYTLSFLVDRTSNKTRNIVMGGNGSASNANLHLFWQGNTTFEHHHWGNNYSVTVPAYDGSSIPGEIIIANLNTAAATNRRNVWRNGTLQGSGTSDQTMVAGSMGTAYLGAFRPTVSQQFLQGRMGEAALYNRPLSTTEFIILNNYKSAKWGVALNAANQFFTAPAGFAHELVGIGRFSASDLVTQTVFTGGGLGMQTTSGNFLSGSGRYLMAAHNGQTGVASSAILVGNGLYETWQRVWNVQKTNPGSDGDLTIYFDFSDYGVAIPSAASNYVLLFDPTDAAFASVNAGVVTATATVSGTRVSFATNSAHILNGYYTIARVIQPIYYSRQSGNWNEATTWSLTGHDGAAAPGIPLIDSEIVIGGNAGNDYTVTLTANVVLNAPGSLTVTDTGDGAGIFSTGTYVLSGSGSFDLETGGSIVIGHASGIASSAATGSIQTTGRSFSAGGRYIYTSSAAQITGTGLPQNLDGLLRINNSAGVTLTRNTRVDGELVLQDGDFIIPSGGSFLAADIDYAGGQFRALRDVFVPAAGTPGGWRLFSSPIDTDYGNLYSELTTQGYTGSSLGTGPTLMPSVLWYDETFPGTDNQRWRAPAAATEALVPGRGLFTYVFGDIPADVRYNQSSVTLAVTGQENAGDAQGSVDFGVTWTETGDDGWNLVGNPFLSTINWDEAGGWTKNEMNNTIYIWDTQANSGAGAFLEWNGSAGSLGNGFIKPFQGFWVKAEAEDPDLVVHSEAKTISTAGTFYRHRPEHPEIEVLARSGGLQSSVYVTFTEDGRTGWDRLDAYRLRSLASDFIELYAVTSEGDRLAINNLPRRFARPVEVSLDLDAMSGGAGFSGDVVLSFGRVARVPSDWVVELVDRKSGQVVVASLSDSSDGVLSGAGQELRFRFQTSSTRSKTVTNLVGTGALGDTKSEESETHLNRRQADQMNRLQVDQNSITSNDETQTTSTSLAMTGSSYSPLNLPETGLTPSGLPASPYSSPNLSQTGLTPSGLPASPYTPPILLKSGTTETRFILRITPTMPDPELPQTFRMDQNYPNPFNPTTTIPIELAGDGYIRLEIYDITGRRLETLLNEYRPAGRHEITWTATRYASGVYLYHLITPETTHTQKMILMK